MSLLMPAPGKEGGWEPSNADCTIAKNSGEQSKVKGWGRALAVDVPTVAHRRLPFGQMQAA